MEQLGIKVDFNHVSIVGNEIEYILQALKNAHISGDGFYSKKCQALLEQELGVSKVLLTTSCTHALEMAALLLGIKPEDEVIVPSFTFVSTINAFVLRGALPRFIDIRPDTLNMNESLLEGLITSRTKAILPVHYAGVGCELDSILEIARKYQIPVVEDNAHGLFGRYKGKFLGTFGSLATQSFHETKNITCGEGGAILINDPAYVEQAEIIREKGTNRSQFFRGQVDKYSWIGQGSSYVPSDILAAFLYAQLEKRELIQSQRKTIWDYYNQHLSEWAEDHNVRLPIIPTHCEQPYHMFYLIFPSLTIRQAMIEHLKSYGIISVFHYVPLHSSKMGIKLGGEKGDCPVTEYVSDRLLRLPFYNSLRGEDLALVVNAIKQFRF